MSGTDQGMLLPVDAVSWDGFAPLHLAAGLLPAAILGRECCATYGGCAAICGGFAAKCGGCVPFMEALLRNMGATQTRMSAMLLFTAAPLLFADAFTEEML